jgi:hypothetical protein
VATRWRTSDPQPRKISVAVSAEERQRIYRAALKNRQRPSGLMRDAALDRVELLEHEDDEPRALTRR